MKSKWKKIFLGDKWGKEFTLILLIAFCSFWLGAMLFILEQLKNLLIVASGFNPEKIILYAPLISTPINSMVLWDLALITIVIVYFVALATVFYYTKKRMAKEEGER